MGFGKYIGAGLGWAFGGPIGALVGFAFGYMMEDKSFKQPNQARQAGSDQYRQQARSDYRQQYQQYRHRTTGNDFASALLVLSAAVMKADGKLMKSELDFIRQFFTQNFGPAVAAEQIGILKELLKKDIPGREVCEQIRYFMEHPMRLQMLHYLFGIARADGNVDKSEVDMIRTISDALGISPKDYDSIRAMFYKDATSAYKILEISSDATDGEVKRAYRRMANKYHPDKVSTLGDSHVKAAKEKFVKVQEAYETIKKERKMK